MFYQGFMRTTVDCHELGYVDAFRDEYQVILMDCRAHGRSHSPHDPTAYAGYLLATDVIAVLDALGVEKTHFVGYSSGGGTGYAVLEPYPDRLLSLAIGGKDVLPLSPGYLDPTIEALSQGIEDFINTRERMAGRPYAPALRSRLTVLDAQAVRNYCITYMSEGVLGLKAALLNATMPCLIYVGSEDVDFDKVKKTSGLIPGSVFRVLDGLNHGEGWDRADIASPVISDFLSLHCSDKPQPIS